MNIISQLQNKYSSLGYSSTDVRLLVAEEIIISKIAQSDLKAVIIGYLNKL